MNKFVADDSSYGSKIKRKEISHDLPYTLIGHTLLPKTFGITLTAKGFKKIAHQLKANDSVSIEIGNSCYFSVQIIRHSREGKAVQRG